MLPHSQLVSYIPSRGFSLDQEMSPGKTTAYLSLGLKCISQVTYLALKGGLAKWHKSIRAAHISVILRYLILQDQMVSKRIPG